MPSEKLSLSIYEIDKSRFPDLTVEEIIEHIIGHAAVEGYRFTLQPLVASLRTLDEVSIYHAVKSYSPKWKNFLEPVLSAESPAIRSTNTIQNFLCFVQRNSKLLAISGGHGNFVLLPYTNDDFGIEILSRLISRDSKVVKSLKDRGLTGTILGGTRFYRLDQKIIDEDQFGKIFKQVQAELTDRQLIQELGFLPGEITRSKVGCLAKTSFEIKKGINFRSMLTLMEKLAQLLDRPPNFSLNMVKQISRRGGVNQQLLDRLNLGFIDKFYQDCLNNQLPDFDFCHPHFEQYFDANSYELNFGSSESLDSEEPFNLKNIVEAIRDAGKMELEDVTFFKHMLLIYNVISRNEDGQKMTWGNLFDHLHGEFRLNGRSYFRIDKEWYIIDPEFITELNADCVEVLEEAWDDSLIEIPFSDRTEREFNSRFIGNENTLVFDTITSENIEACDILKWDANKTYVIHVKKGFNNSIRDLAAQVAISARRIAQDKHANGTFLDSLQEKAFSGRTSQNLYLQRLSYQSFPADGIKTLFDRRRDKDISFCLVFVDTAAERRSLKQNIEMFNSNIAKYAVIELNREVRRLGFDFRVIQLSRADESGS